MLHNPKIAVIQFPGSNCELETARAVERNGMTAEHFRWNENKSLAGFDGAVLVGGFSHEDRGRSGLIASKDPLTQEIFKLAQRGGVVFGICNGAQILVETGLVPNFEFGKSVLALTRNRRVKDGEVVGEGYFNEWIYVRPQKTRPNAFNQFGKETLKIPVAHGEGRFFSQDADLIAKIVDENLNAFVYCDAEGNISPEFPTNPNGSILNLAGVTNSAGNVCALMPHPERTTAGDPIFRSIKKWLAGKAVKPAARKIKFAQPASKISPAPKLNTEFFVKLKITDNEALSVGRSAGIALDKYRFFAFDFSGSKSDLEKIIRGGSLLNAEKEDVFVKTKGKVWKFSKDHGFVPAKLKLPKNRILARENEASLDESRAANLNRQLGQNSVKNFTSGVLWGTDDPQAKFEKAVRNNFFHHPAAMNLAKI
ncbi:MAG: phosphoribosylformylglycinamidine synthase I [Candidatus Peribacteraceae bacterium]|nr:phosphoribosylformylglycinamidine synthase I [Candidatus Peribacteraceae bacterium]